MRGSNLRREFRRIKGEVVFGLVRGFDGVVRPVFGKRAAGGANIIRCYLVRSDKPGLRAKFCSHVGHGHAFLHRQIPDGRAGILDGLIPAATHADLAADGQHHVLGRDAGTKTVVPLDQDGFGNAEPDFTRS